MERLTEIASNGTACYIEPSVEPTKWERNRHNVLQKLAAYEDTGLEPEDVVNVFPTLMNAIENNNKFKQYQALGTVEDFQRLVTAQNEGRLVELPCKVGDKVKVDVRTWGNAWNFKTIENGKFLVGEIISIIKTKKQTLMKIQVEHNVSWKRERKRYGMGALGVTVFFHEEAAEALTKEGKQ